MSTHHWIDVAVQTPAHSQVGGLLSYRSPFLVRPGQLVRVPLGRREVLGVVWAVLDDAPTGMPASAVRDVLGVLKLQSDRLDFEYLQKWALELELSDLLETACTESGLEILYF